MKPNFNEEKKLWKKGYKFVAGLDEAGRGPLAGPVVAAAVVVCRHCEQSEAISKSRLPRRFAPRNDDFEILSSKIKDSKLLSAKQREEVYKNLMELTISSNSFSN